MEIVIKPDPASASLLAATAVSRLLRTKPECVLGLATGESPRRLYEELVRLHRDTGLDFSAVTTFNLDEYVGIGGDHPASYCRYMHEHLFDRVNMRPERVHVPNGLAPDVRLECATYEHSIKAAGGIDLQVLGVGVDGHIAFNEPSSSLASRTRIKTLTPVTRRENAPAFGGEEAVPRHVITMGIGTILDARRCLVLAFGAKKADAVAAMVEGPLTASVPASALQLHEHVMLIVDEAAAAKLTRADYYRWVYDQKPVWQRVE